MSNKIPSLTLVTLIILSLSACQFFPELESSINQTVVEGEQKLQEIKTTVREKTDEIQSTYTEVKTGVETKIEQFNEAGQKIEEAQKAFTEAQEAVSNLTR